MKKEEFYKFVNIQEKQSDYFTNSSSNSGSYLPISKEKTTANNEDIMK